MYSVEQPIGFPEAFFGNGASVWEYLAFTVFCFLGMIFYKFIELNKAQKSYEGNFWKEKFSWRVWRRENGLDFAIAFMAAMFVFRFFPESLQMISNVFPALPEEGEKAFYGLVLGIGFQYGTHKLLKGVNVVVEK